MSIVVSMGIAKDIKRELKKRGWSQYRLAQESGLSNAKISDLITQDRDPQMSTLIPLANGFSITIDELVNNPKPTTKIRGKPMDIKGARQCLKELGLGSDEVERLMVYIKYDVAQLKGQGKEATG